MLSKPLGEIEKKMPEGSFYRVHTSHSINVEKVKNVIQQDGGYIEMKDGTQVPLARRRKQDFINLLK
jgi:two-component system LytT family response regulator